MRLPPGCLRQGGLPTKDRNLDEHLLEESPFKATVLCTLTREWYGFVGRGVSDSRSFWDVAGVCRWSPTVGQ